MIGQKFKYPNGKQVFILKEIAGFIYRFECGHWVTDSVFEDLIRVNYGTQTTLF